MLPQIRHTNSIFLLYLGFTQYPFLEMRLNIFHTMHPFRPNTVSLIIMCLLKNYEMCRIPLFGQSMSGFWVSPII